MMVNNFPILTPSDFVSILNQTLEISFPIAVIEGEISNFKIAKNRWVYFDIKDEYSSIKCFSSVYSLRMPIENGMVVTLTARPQLHPQYNFSLNVIDVVPKGEGSIKKAADLLKEKLEKEGLFKEERKRVLPYPPSKVGLITSSESAAYGDFTKILQKRWPIMSVILADTKVQGADATGEIVNAIHSLNQGENIEVIVIIRGGGSADDLLAFQEESLVRAISESRVPTLVAIGHERDFSLAELAADLRASTPSNAAELLSPSKEDYIAIREQQIRSLKQKTENLLTASANDVKLLQAALDECVNEVFKREKDYLVKTESLLKALDPTSVLKRGYAVVRNNKFKVVRSKKDISLDDIINIQLADDDISARVLG